MSKRMKGNVCLLTTAVIWGFAVVAQKNGMEYMPPFLYSGIRMYIGTLGLLTVLFIARKRPGFQRITGGVAEKEYSGKQKRQMLFSSAMACGTAMFFAANAQQVGLFFTTVSKTSFITTLYIVLVPLMGIFLKHKITRHTWLGVAFATVGLYLLCITEAFTITFGDLIVLVGAAFWGVQILLMDYYVRRLPVLEIAAAQFLVAGTISFIVSPFLDPCFDIEMNTITFVHALPSILYVGVISTAGAAAFQGLGQKNAGPVAASIILSLESVFGAIFGFLFLNEILTSREMTGCILMFGAVLIVQQWKRDS